MRAHEEKPDEGEAYLRCIAAAIAQARRLADFLVRRRMTPENGSRMPISFPYICAMD